MSPLRYDIFTYFRFLFRYFADYATISDTLPFSLLASAIFIVDSPRHDTAAFFRRHCCRFRYAAIRFRHDCFRHDASFRCFRLLIFRCHAFAFAIAILMLSPACSQLYAAERHYAIIFFFILTLFSLMPSCRYFSMPLRAFH